MTQAGISAFQELEKLEEERRESEEHNEKHEKGNFANQRKSGSKNLIAKPKGTASNESIENTRSQGRTGCETKFAHIGRNETPLEIFTDKEGESYD